ncbi:recombinase family protein [Salinisphaera orenii]|uniref:Resolvase n=1 Tax=Salinisphaera orenii YIM 95161 TaxID=1051139 RepID=A0A423PM82_9GAMM|nr:recombinase family protein [Salinisphaera halophila]ROO26725.1 resolvase [Salinisphaera halophila YIM 95161]
MTNKTQKVALYARVSTDGQSCENQLDELREVADAAGWTVVGEYVDAGISGGKGRDERPEFDRMLKDAVRRKISMVAAWSVDRLGRSTQDLSNFMAELHATGCGLYLHRQGVDTTTPAGRAMFQMFGLFAEFERSMIRERVNAGLDRARAKGKQLGRPAVAEDTKERIRELRAKGWGKKKVARELGCGVGTVGRVEAETQPETSS